MRSKIAALLFAAMIVAVGISFPYFMTQPASGATEMLCQGSDFSNPMVACNTAGAMIVAASGTFTVAPNSSVVGGMGSGHVYTSVSTSTLTLPATATQIVFQEADGTTSRTCVSFDNTNCGAFVFASSSISISGASIKVIYLKEWTASRELFYTFTLAQ